MGTDAGWQECAAKNLPLSPFSSFFTTHVGVREDPSFLECHSHLYVTSNGMEGKGLWTLFLTQYSFQTHVRDSDCYYVLNIVSKPMTDSECYTMALIKFPNPYKSSERYSLLTVASKPIKGIQDVTRDSIVSKPTKGIQNITRLNMFSDPITERTCGGNQVVYGSLGAPRAHHTPRSAPIS